MVMGASPRPHRFSHIATLRLLEAGFEVVPIGIHSGVIGGQVIIDLKGQPAYADIHTVTMYLNRINQRSWYEYILKLRPERVIFNPGSENPELYRLLFENEVVYLEACTLVMLATGSYYSGGIPLK